MPTRHYVNTAAPTSLRADVTATATALSVSSLSGYPTSYPYTVTIEADKAGLGEACEVTAATIAADGTATLTVVRGVDGTTARTHPASSRVAHDHTARDWAEPQARLDALEAGRFGPRIDTVESRVTTLDSRVTTADQRATAAQTLLDREQVHRIMRPGEFVGIMRHFGPVTGAAAFQPLITVPANTKVVVKTITVTNLSGSWLGWTLGINSYHMVEGIPIAPYTTITVDLAVALNAADVFQVSASNGDVRFTCSASVEIGVGVGVERFWLHAQNTATAGSVNHYGFGQRMTADGRNRVLRSVLLSNMGDVDLRASLTLNDAAILGNVLVPARSFQLHDVNLNVNGGSNVKVGNESASSDLRTAGFGHLVTV